MTLDNSIAIIIPCHRVYPFLCEVLLDILHCQHNYTVYLVDDHCPNDSIKQSLESYYSIPGSYNLRINYLQLDYNQGVGGAWLAGLASAIQNKHDYFIKLDGDNQHRMSEIEPYILPLIMDMDPHSMIFLKGNRFHSKSFAQKIPPIRLVGNIALSLLSRLSSGNWGISDPVCGCFCVSRSLGLQFLDCEIKHSFLFESDLIRITTFLNANIIEFPLNAYYGSEISNMNIYLYVLPFLRFHIASLIYRVMNFHIIRALTPEGIFFLGFLFCLACALVSLIYIYFTYLRLSLFAPTGTIMLFLLLAQSSLLFFVNFLKEDSESYKEFCGKNKPTL